MKMSKFKAGDKVRITGKSLKNGGVGEVGIIDYVYGEFDHCSVDLDNGQTWDVSRDDLDIVPSLSFAPLTPDQGVPMYSREYLRDQFAMAALTGLVTDGLSTRYQMAGRSYQIADAMLKARDEL